MKKLKNSVLDLIELLNDNEKGEIYLKLDKTLWQKTRGELEQEIRDLKEVREQKNIVNKQKCYGHYCK